MLSNAIRASHRGVTCLARHQAAVTTRRAFASSTQRRADLIQDMYIKNLKDTKPTPVKPGDEKGQVKQFEAPKAPKSPEEGDLANELKAYESEKPEIEGQAEGSGSTSEQHQIFEEDDFDLQKEWQSAGDSHH